MESDSPTPRGTSKRIALEEEGAHTIARGCKYSSFAHKYPGHGWIVVCATQSAPILMFPALEWPFFITTAELKQVSN